MQVADGLAALRAQIEDAFRRVEVPAADDVLAERFRTSIDPGELLAAFRGRHWQDLSPHELFIHRESLSALSALGFRAYVAAYLLGALEGEEAADLAEYTLFSLHPLSAADRNEAECRERLSLLDDTQRSAVRRWLEHIADDHELASKILSHWQ